jgi:hypothetical protein
MQTDFVFARENRIVLDTEANDVTWGRYLNVEILPIESPCIRSLAHVCPTKIEKHRARAWGKRRDTVVVVEKWRTNIKERRSRLKISLNDLNVKKMKND